MGAHPYWYVVNYAPDLDRVLQSLRQREFAAGRYNPVMPFISFPITPQSPTPGPRHASIDDAMTAADADGTRSILDIASISESPDFYAAAPLADDILTRLYGTTRPTRAAVEANMEFFDDIERGQAIYIVLYKDEKPSEVLFAGYSFD